MYHHVKTLMYTVRVDEPDPRFGNICSSNLAARMGSLRQPGNIQSRA
jgi:Mn-containing catalase